MQKLGRIPGSAEVVRHGEAISHLQYMYYSGRIKRDEINDIYHYHK